MHERAREWRVGDDHIRVAVGVDCQRVLAGCYAPSIKATQPTCFEMAHQCAIAATWFCEMRGPRNAAILAQVAAFRPAALLSRLRRAYSRALQIANVKAWPDRARLSA
jgi:hypothetical protein